MTKIMPTVCLVPCVMFLRLKLSSQGRGRKLGSSTVASPIWKFNTFDSPEGEQMKELFAKVLNRLTESGHVQFKEETVGIPTGIDRPISSSPADTM